MLDGIHPGEVEGKEASLALVRNLLDGRHPDWLDALVLLVDPCSTRMATTRSTRGTAASTSRSSPASQVPSSAPAPRARAST